MYSTFIITDRKFRTVYIGTTCQRPTKRLKDMQAAARKADPKNSTNKMFAWLRRNKNPTLTVIAVTNNQTAARAEAQRHLDSLEDTTRLMNSPMRSYTRRSRAYLRSTAKVTFTGRGMLGRPPKHAE